MRQLIEFSEPTRPLGYSCHGCPCSFEGIVELEQDRENEPFSLYTADDIEPYRDKPAIWLTKDPFSAFLYAIPADDWNLPSKDIVDKYPDWKDHVTIVETKGYQKLTDSDDGMNGFLFVQL